MSTEKGVRSPKRPLTRANKPVAQTPPQKRPSDVVPYAMQATETVAAMDHKGAIIKAIKSFDVRKAKGWAALSHHHDNLTLVAFDPVVTSIGVTPAGQFSSLANVLLSTNAVGFNGKDVQVSLTVPALVDGDILGETVKIKRVELRLREPAGGYAAGGVFAGAAE